MARRACVCRCVPNVADFVDAKKKTRNSLASRRFTGRVRMDNLVRCLLFLMCVCVYVRALLLVFVRWARARVYFLPCGFFFECQCVAPVFFFFLFLFDRGGFLALASLLVRSVRCQTVRDGR